MCSVADFEYRRQKCSQTIENIQIKKSEIAETLRKLGIHEVQEDEEVKFTINQLMTAYDSICSHEKRWTDLLKEIDDLERAEVENQRKSN